MRHRKHSTLILQKPDTSQMNRPTEKQWKKLDTGAKLLQWVEEHNPNFSVDQREQLVMDLSRERDETT